MPISIQPAFDALPSYRPVKFESFSTTTPSVVVENAVVELYRGAAIVPIVTERYKSSRVEPSFLPGLLDYYFEIDVQKFIQDVLAPTADLPSIMFDENTPPVDNVDFYGDFRIEITYEIINAISGLVVPAGFPPEVSNTFTVYTASKQHQEQMDLTDFIGAPIQAPETRFITKSPRSLKVKNNNFAFLSVIQPNIPLPLNGFRVELFDAAGALLYFGVAATGASAFSTQQTVNTGFEALSNITWLDGAPNFSDPLIVSYTISLGYLFIFPGPTIFYLRQTEIFNYELTGLCCGKRDLRLHFMNLLGGADSYTFNSEKDLILSTSSDRSQKALKWQIGSTTPHDVSDVGNFKIKSEGSTAYSLTSRFLTNQEATWLGELLTSPKVYAEIDGNFVPVIIEDTQQSIDRHSGKIKYSIVATLSNDLIIQRV